MDDLDLKTAKGLSTLDEIFLQMRCIQVMTSKPVELTLYSDGSGSLDHPSLGEQHFGKLPVALYQLKQLYQHICLNH